MLWIAVHLPQLSLESFAATLPAAQQVLPMALLAEHRVVALDAAAAKTGIRPGHKRATALALAPALVIGEADAVRDAAQLHATAHAALAFTPSVALQADEHVVLLEVQSCLRYWGGLPRLLQRLQQAMQPLGHALRIATAPTAFGAALLARWREGLAFGPHTHRLDALAQRLGEVPVWLLGSGRQHWDALQGMGLHTLADLRSLPRTGLARRFGPQLLQDLDRAHGLRPDPRDWIVPPPVFDSRLELFARADTTEQVLHGAAVLLERLVAWAQAQHARVGGFTLCMHHEPRHREGRAVAGCSTLEVALAQPAGDADHLQLLLRERLANTALAAPTLELSLECRQAVKGPPPNAELFPTPGSEREGLGRLVERLQARLGRERVLQVQLRPAHRPEYGSVLKVAQAVLAAPGLAYEAATKAQRRGPHGAQEAAPDAAREAAREAVQGAAQRTQEPTLPLTRPVWLLPEPEPLPERQFKPLLDGQPLQLLAGPERIETGWWDAAAAQRDYFVAQAADGALVWVYRDRLPRSLDAEDGASGWYLHGRFG